MVITLTGPRPYRADDPRLWDDGPRACAERRKEAREALAPLSRRRAGKEVGLSALVSR